MVVGIIISVWVERKWITLTAIFYLRDKSAVLHILECVPASARNNNDIHIQGNEYFRVARLLM